MPWKESSVMEERLRFVARLLEGESMTHVCHHFGISRKTGYKIYNRYKHDGVEHIINSSTRAILDFPYDTLLDLYRILTLIGSSSMKQLILSTIAKERCIIYAVKELV